MNRATYTLLKQSGGVGMYAEVSVSANRDARERAVTISQHIYDWEREAYGLDDVVSQVKEDDEFVRGARKGIEYALDRIATPIDRNRISVEVDKIHVLLCDSTENTVAYAACYATWQALEVKGSIEPKIVGREIIFPDN
jgi:hypothetical protein